jgi:hypothetical protein
MNHLPPRVVPGRAEIQGLQLLESCSFRWIFDGATNRFRRTPRDAAVWSESLADWTEYHHLEIDEARSCFVVRLDEERTRVVRAWLHSDPCRRCGRDGRSTGDLQLRIRAWKDRLRVLEPRLVLSPNGGRHPLRAFGGWGLSRGHTVTMERRGSGRG